MPRASSHRIHEYGSYSPAYVARKEYPIPANLTAVHHADTHTLGFRKAKIHLTQGETWGDVAHAVKRGVAHTLCYTQITTKWALIAKVPNTGDLVTCSKCLHKMTENT